MLSKSKFSLPKVTLHIIPVVLLLSSVAILFPFYRYYIDPDAVSYLTLINRYLEGDWQQAVNAYWSPMGVWLTVLWVQLSGWEAFNAALWVNAWGAVGVIIAGQSLFHQFRKSMWERFCFGIMSAIFWATTVYLQSFTDIWQIFFLLIALLILLRNDFLDRKLWWFALGFIGALAYFSKAFSFYFVPLMTMIAVAVHLKHTGKWNWKSFITINLIVGFTLLLFAFPWIYLLHQKYGIWTNSTAGKMNLGWQLLGHPNFKEDIHILIPPAPFQHSLFYFEDAYLVEDAPVTIFQKPIYVLKLIARILYNCLDWVKSSNYISPFYFVAWLLSVLVLFSKKLRNNLNTNLQILIIVCLVYPLPYLLLTFDKGRYLWFTIPLITILGMTFYSIYLKEKWSVWVRRVFVAVFFASFIPVTLLEMKDLWKKGKEDYEIAMQLKERNIQGSFALNAASTSPFGHSALRIAYWTQSPFYSYGLEQWSTKEILEDAKRYNVEYFFYRYQGVGNDYELYLLNGEKAEDVTHGEIDGLKVFRLKN